MIKRPTLQEIYDFSRSMYYTDEETPWEPFEYYDKDQLAEFVMSHAISLLSFLGIKYQSTDLDKCIH